MFITISHLFVSRPTLEFTIFEQQVYSTTQMYYHWEQTAAKKKKMDHGNFEQRTSSKKAV